VPRVANASVSPGVAEWLTGQAGGPHGLVIGPSGQSERQLPSADSGKEVNAGMSHKVVCSHFADAAVVNRGIGPELAEPCGAESVMVVEEHITDRAADS